VATASLAELRNRLDEAYDSQHTGGGGGEAAAPDNRRDIRPLRSSAVGPVVDDLGCGRGDIVRLLQADGFGVEGIDISPEQSAFARTATVMRVCHGDFRVVLVVHPDETPGASWIARHFGHAFQRVQTVLEDSDVARFFQATPHRSVAALNTHLICRAVHEAGFQMALSGFGGDEAVGGPSHFRLPKYLPMLRGTDAVPLPVGVAAVKLACVGAVPLTWILTPADVFLACNQVTEDMLRSRKRPLVVARTQGLAAVFMMTLLMALLPVAGVYGAAIASTAAYGVALVVMLLALRKLPSDSPGFRRARRPADEDLPRGA
jgi:Polysaccharide biosynthesis C-terminal domain/Asparagine synthase